MATSRIRWVDWIRCIQEVAGADKVDLDQSGSLRPYFARRKRLTAEHRAPDPDVAYLLLGDRIGVLFQHGEIGVLAGGNAADLVLHAVREGGFDGHHA